MCMGGGGGEWDVYDVSRQRSRKERRCSECNRTIAVGERYARHTGIARYEGVSTWVKCDQCEAALEWLGIVCDGYLHEMCLEDLREHLHEAPPVRSLSLARLVRYMDRRWLWHGDELVPVDTVERWVKTATDPITASLVAEQERRSREYAARNAVHPAETPEGTL